MRAISEVARDIAKAWPKPYFGAVPYLKAMFELNDISDYYGMEEASGIILYFLSNASGFRGPVAKELKAELKAIVGVKR